ncbi:MAG: ABC transporter permease [Chloroflexi bacterium]|nr:ABC transporter permease [Chloroflexota bacterium]MBI3741063.1 ABC transporter permease [Chloroflexota bacterium]
MASTTVAQSNPIAPPTLKASPGYFTESYLRFRRDRISMLALAMFIVICILSITAPLISEFVLHTNPTKQDLLLGKAPPSAVHWGGTDDFGRDALSRVLFAGQVSLAIGFAVAGLQMLIGVPTGLIAGFYHGKIDDVVNAIILTRLGIPTFYLLILLSATFRGFVGTPWGLSIIFGILGWTGVARQVRGLVLSVKQRDFVDAAKVVGARDRRIMFRHLLPNIMYIILIIAGFDIVGAMLGEAGLSFLGLGIQPPTASWGNMLAGSLENFQDAPWLVFLPGLFITITVLCIFVATDGLRDALDPRLKE